MEIEEAIERCKNIIKYKLENDLSLKENQAIEIVLEELNNRISKENEELEFKLLARERGEAEFEVLVDTLKKENKELKKDRDFYKEIAMKGGQ